jgi:hypothetical protein
MVPPPTTGTSLQFASLCLPFAYLTCRKRDIPLAAPQRPSRQQNRRGQFTRSALLEKRKTYGFPDRCLYVTLELVPIYGPPRPKPNQTRLG